MANLIKDMLSKIIPARTVTSRIRTTEGNIAIGCYRCKGAPATLVKVTDTEIAILGLKLKHPGEQLYACKHSCPEQQGKAVEGYIHQATQQIAYQQEVLARVDKEDATRKKNRLNRYRLKPFRRAQKAQSR